MAATWVASSTRRSSYAPEPPPQTRSPKSLMKSYCSPAVPRTNSFVVPARAPVIRNQPSVTLNVPLLAVPVSVPESGCVPPPQTVGFPVPAEPSLYTVWPVNTAVTRVADVYSTVSVPVICPLHVQVPPVIARRCVTGTTMGPLYFIGSGASVTLRVRVWTPDAGAEYL